MMHVCCGADGVLRGMLSECGLLLRGYGDFIQPLLMLSNLLRDTRVNFHRECDRELSEL